MDAGIYGKNRIQHYRFNLIKFIYNVFFDIWSRFVIFSFCIDIIRFGPKKDSFMKRASGDGIQD